MVAEEIADVAAELDGRLGLPQLGEDRAVEVEHARLAGEPRASARREVGHLVVGLVALEIRADLRRVIGKLQACSGKRFEDGIGGIDFREIEITSAAIRGVKAFLLFDSRSHQRATA